jgi:DNA-binding beta-propeller fold protein YncE
MLACLGAAVAMACEAPAGATNRIDASDPLLVEVARVALTGVDGRIDHLAYDASGSRLYVAALGNGTIEVVDVAKGAVASRIDKLEEPQGVVCLPDSKQVAFTTGGDGKLRVYDAAALTKVKELDAGGDADNVRLDAKAGLVYVGCEEGLAVVDVKKWERVATIKLAGHAESFQLEPDGSKIYVNVPDARHVAVVDAKERKAVATWTLGDASSNFPMALDSANGRLFVGCRSPACLLVLDVKDGRRVAKLPIGGDCDDVFFDAQRKRIYASCGEGVVSVIGVKSADEYEAIARIPTASGARTSLFVPSLSRLFVVAPKRGDRAAEIHVLEAK